MKTLFWLLVLLFDAAFLALAVFTAASPAVSGMGRAMGGVAAAALTVTVVVLVLARMGRGASPPTASMLRVACILAPASWFMGTLDARLPTLLETGFLVLATAVALGSWRVYRRFAPAA